MKGFTADAGPAPRARPAALKSRVLVVQATSVSAFYDSQRLVYSRAPGERAYYQFAAWTERPGRAFSKLLSERLDAPFTSSAVRGDLVLHTRLEGLRAAFPAGEENAAAAVAAASRAIAEVLDDIAAWLEGPKAADPVARS